MQYGDPLRVIYGKNEENEAERVVAEIIRERFFRTIPAMVTTPFSIVVIINRACLKRR